ncbi:MAG: hypothetical protein U9P10_04130 [Thermodesulfobacteriota bacterium]|nr:hypothetical protein [Thermodesulfobacteriota bacterium]
MVFCLEASTRCPNDRAFIEMCLDVITAYLKSTVTDDDAVPGASIAGQNWTRLIQKIYEVDPLICPKCQGQIKIISIIDDFEIIEMILKTFESLGYPQP